MYGARPGDHVTDVYNGTNPPILILSVGGPVMVQKSCVPIEVSALCHSCLTLLCYVVRTAASRCTFRPKRSTKKNSTISSDERELKQ